MLRPANSSRAPNDQHTIDLLELFEDKTSPKKMTEGRNGLPLYEKHSGDDLWLWLLDSHNRVHLIPVVVFLCVFTLWWFSYPVRLDIKDGVIVGIHRTDLPDPPNKTAFDLAILARNTSVSNTQMKNNKETAAQTPGGNARPDRNRPQSPMATR